MNRLALFRQRMDALYRADARGKLLHSNEWDARPAPRFHLMRTADGALCRFRPDVPDDIVERLAALCRQEPLDHAFDERPVYAPEYLECLAAHAPVRTPWAGPAYMSPPDVAPRATVTKITPANAHLLRPLFANWLPDVIHRQPFIAMVENDVAVAICCSVRITPAVHCAGVETHIDHRRKGHAANAVAGWVCAVRSLGAEPFYSTSWENIGSRGVAARLGMTLAGVDFHVG